MTWLLLILYVSGTSHSPATLTTIRNFRSVAACEATAAALQHRAPARGSVATVCVPQPGSRRRA